MLKIFIVSFLLATVIIAATFLFFYESQSIDLTLEEKVGQLLIAGFNNDFVDSQASELITKYKISGFNLLKRNIKNSDQVQNLIQKLQSLSNTSLFIAVDQEGGVINRLNFLNELTSQLDIDDSDEAYQVGFRRGQELKDLEINMVFSPVLDFVSDKNSYLYKRTFGKKPDEIKVLGQAMIQGYTDAQIISVPKHFPGYGNVTQDPHQKLVYSKGIEEALVPFESLNSQAVMTAHIIIPEFDSKPATLSEYFLNNILKKKLKFSGLIISDDIGMASIDLSIDRAAVQAINAGVDLIICTSNFDDQVMILNSLKKAVLQGEISKSRLNQAVTRILELKNDHK